MSFREIGLSPQKLVDLASIVICVGFSRKVLSLAFPLLPHGPRSHGTFTDRSGAPPLWYKTEKSHELSFLDSSSFFSPPPVDFVARQK